MGRRLAIAVLLAGALPALAAPVASATFHEMLIREVYAGSAARPDSEYVELQMWAAGQNLVGGHSLRTYGASGSIAGTTTFSGDVPGDANQSTILLATPAAESDFGIVPDAAMAPGLLDAAGGAVCWESLDCVAWGSFVGTLPSPTGSPAAPAGIADGMALRRTISPGCASLLEATDDRDNSAADFSAVFPSPRPNSIVPSERGCTSGSGQPGGPVNEPSGQDQGAPRTVLKRKPPHATPDRTPTFHFASSEPGSTFQCKVDRHPFKPCRSPFTAQRLDLGRHVFRVRARDESGEPDPSPRAYRFEVIEAGRARPG